MIKTSRQLKDKVRNMARGDSAKAQLLIRNYGMERFLERVSLSEHRDNFILKGGMLVSAMVGLENRATMDIDTSIRNMPLDTIAAKAMVEEIIAVPVDDNIRFEINDFGTIMDDAEYSGVRISLNAFLDATRIPLKIDISTGDAITPAAVNYQYKLMFEERYITLWAYNLETVLAEKIETVLSRSVLNTRLRDFYDLYVLQDTGLEIDKATLAAALTATARKRGSEQALALYERTLDEIRISPLMREQWERYQGKNNYAASIVWDDVISDIRALCDDCCK
jgi:predicted nucleotidyltransferase component of viral defense system